MAPIQCSTNKGFLHHTGALCPTSALKHRQDVFGRTYRHASQTTIRRAAYVRRQNGVGRVRPG